MNIKHVITTGFVTIFAAALTMVGCNADSASDTEGDEETNSNSEAVAVIVNCTSTSPNGLASSNYSNAIAATEATAIAAIGDTNTVYDITSYCTAAINARRTTVHSRTKSGVTTTIQPYYNLYDAQIVSPYTAIAINVAATNSVATPYSSSVCRLCEGLSNAKAGDHSNYGACGGAAPDATGPLTADVADGFCGVTVGTTAKNAVDTCLNSFESEDGPGAGHKGPMVWDTTRGISCLIGVYVDPVTLVKKAGLTVNYSYPPRNALAPNGAACKVSGECLSKKCAGRCVGFNSSIRVGSTTATAGVSTCPAADSKNGWVISPATVAVHSEDPALWFSKNLACASGTCTGGICAKGGLGKSCVVAGDCSSNICTGGLCQ
jgi:hypothetical protein